MKNLKFLKTFALVSCVGLSYFVGYSQSHELTTFSVLTTLLMVSTISLACFFIYNYKKAKDLSDTLAATHEELQMTKEKTDQLAAVKSKFTSTVSHELRTPLYGVIGLSTILMDRIKDDENQKYIKLMKFSADHLLNLINDVLQVSKMESNEVSLDNIEYNIKNLAENIKSSFEFQSENNGNTLHLNYDKQIPEHLIGDSVRLSQIILNLVSNANKFTKNGDIWLNIKNSDIKDNKVAITFEVKDNGAGIPLEQQNIIFDKFSQADAEHNPGTGIGLNIAQNLTKLFGGEIKLTSTEGKGATFYFTIPFEIDTTKTTQKPQNIEKINAIMNNNEKTNEPIPIEESTGFHILVVEDNKINQIVTQKILKTKDYTSEIAEDGLIAVEMVKNNTYDLILMDLNMPNMDGKEATKKIREFDLNTPIIALTASDADETNEMITAEGSGFNDFLQKPFKNEEFFETIDTNINNNISSKAS